MSNFALYMEAKFIIFIKYFKESSTLDEKKKFIHVFCKTNKFKACPLQNGIISCHVEQKNKF